MIAVIGSSGLLGGRVVERLAARGHQVLAASRKKRTRLPVGARASINVTGRGIVLKAEATLHLHLEEPPPLLILLVLLAFILPHATR